jgi:microcystin-dependent protein
MMSKRSPSTELNRRALRPCTRMFATFVLICAGAAVTNAQDFYIGEILLVPYDFAPVGTLNCNGQLLPISTNTALFSLLGTTYGGDGRSTFALPNLNDRTPIADGSGAGLTPRPEGESGGASVVTLLTTQIPAHTHLLNANSGTGSTASPSGGCFAANAAGVPNYAASSNSVLFNASALSATGGSQPHNNWQPYTGLKFVIVTSGIYPPRY